jgi:hypothetical protein
MRVFENTVPRKMFGLKRDKVTQEWRRLHNEKLYALYSSPNIIWVINQEGDGQGMKHVWGRVEVHAGFY